MFTLLSATKERHCSTRAVRTANACTEICSTLVTQFVTVACVLAICLIFSATSAKAEKSQTIQGRASWYGTTAHGKRTANGEIFNRYSLTAAHKKLPFGTVLRVVNTRNGKEVLVRINDRGPYVEGRILDLSHRAAEILRMKGSGVTPVVCEIVTNGEGKPINPESAFYVHIASEQNPFRAKQLGSELDAALKQPVRVLLSINDGRISYNLCLGPYSTFGKAQRAFIRLEEKRVTPRNIIEAPWDGGVIPDNSPARASVTDGKKQAPELAGDDTPRTDSATLWNTMLHAVSTLTPPNHLVTYALSKLY